MRCSGCATPSFSKHICIYTNCSYSYPACFVEEYIIKLRQWVSMEEGAAAGNWMEIPNLLPKRMMESLTAACDALLPSADAPVVNYEDADDDGEAHAGLAELYGTSASMAGTPDYIGRLMSEGGMKHAAWWKLRIVLWLLSTWYGTLAFCGGRSVSTTRFPFVRRLSALETEKREEILAAWSRSSLPPFRMLYNSLKFLTARIYFTQLRDDNTNPAWKAMGYCGPDPDFTDQVQRNGEEDDSTNQDEELLRSALLRMDNPRDVIAQMLVRAGFPASTTSPPSSPLTISCDAVVIGSGAGGSVVAGILAKAGHKVIVLEKGYYFPRSRLSLLEGPALRDMYEGGGFIATDDVQALLLAGSTIGGGSAINWSASVRTPDHVRREWCDRLGLGLFCSKAYDDALDAVCGRMGVQCCVEDEGFSNMILRRGCGELGLPVVDVPRNAPCDHYCGWCHLGCKSGKKNSTDRTWLADLADSGNGLILPCCKAVRILHRRKGKVQRDRSIAYGVAVESGGREFTIMSKVTVVACGALNTPTLLKRSGLKNPHIGKHLHIHPVVMAWGYFPPTRWPEASKKSYEGGILTAMCPLTAYSDASGYGTLLQTPALHPGMFATVMPWRSAADFRERMRRFPRTAHVFALVRDRGSGSVDYPGKLRYRLDKEDERRLKVGLEAAVRILAAAGAEEVGTQHAKGKRIKVGTDGRGVEEAVREVRRRGLRDGRTPVTSAHQMGSCRMAAAARKGAVSPQGETWEVERLYVADTSVFPTALGVNPMVTVQAIAYCTAQGILQALNTQ